MVLLYPDQESRLFYNILVTQLMNELDINQFIGLVC